MCLTDSLDLSGSGVYLFFIFCQEIGVFLFEERVDDFDLKTVYFSG